MESNLSIHSKIYKTIKIKIHNITYIQLSIFVAILSFLYVLPILLTNTFYIDDMNRTVEGYNWNRDARFISSEIMNFLSFQKRVVFSGFPFSTILSAFLLSFSGFILSYIIGIRNKIFLFFGSLLLLTCPFILEILWYKFDCIPISLSLFFAVFPFTFYNKPIRFCLASVLSVFIIFGLYQTTTLSYSIILIFFSIRDIWKKEYKLTLKNVIIGLFSFLTGFIFYFSVVKIKGIEMVDDRRAEFIFKGPNFIQLLNERFEGFKTLFFALYHSSYNYLIGFLLIFVVIGIFTLFKKTKWGLQRYLQVILIIGLLAFAVVLTLGINLFVFEARWSPRSLIGFGFLFYLVLFAIYQIPKYKEILVFIALAPVVYYSFLISSQLGIFIKNQEEFSDFVIHQVATEVLKYDHLKLVIDGEIKYTERNKTVHYETLPIIYKLAPKYENYSFYWGMIRMNKFGMFSYEYVHSQEREDVLKSYETLPIIQSNPIYELRIQEPYAVIKFK